MNGGGRNLAYDATPPLSAPLRFFLTAPLFGVVAGLVLLAGGPEILASRWTPGALALTHLVAVGFMLSVMLGALMQILPVVAGAALPAPAAVATVVHVALAGGAACLGTGFYLGHPALLIAAAGMLGLALVVFLGAAGAALLRQPASQPTPRDLRIALGSLAVAGGLGLLLALVLGRGLPLPLDILVKLHVGWAWLGWAGILLAATSWVVVPMFQITPNYAAPLTRWWAVGTATLLALWSALVALGAPLAQQVLEIALALAATTFAVATLRLQARSRRTTPDATFRAFRLAMACLVAGAGCAVAGDFSELAAWPVAAGVLILHGGFVGAIEGMLYKIVPFLAWLHLTQAGIKAPNMKKLLPDVAIRRQLTAHRVALVLTLGAAMAPQTPLAYVAGAAVVVDFGWLFLNLVRVRRNYQGAVAPSRAPQAAAA